MKEATGELNMTVVTIVAIAALVGFFYLVIWPVIQTGMTLSSACNASNGGKQYYKQTVNNKEVLCGPTSSAGEGKCSYDGSTRACQDTNN